MTAVRNVISIGALALSVTAASAAGNTSFSANTIKGTYVFTEQGSTSNNAPYSGLGSITLDGVSNAIGTETIQSTGSNVTTAFTGSYTVNADGSGTITVMHTIPSADASADPVTFEAKYRILLVKSGQELRAIRQENGIFVITTFVQQ